MKLDANMLRYLSKDEWRVLTSVEMGQKNHEIVPVPLIDSIAGLKRGGTYTCLKTLLKHKLLHHDASKYDGFRLTYLGYDYLALRTLVARGSIAAVGRQIGVGKESDVFEVINEDGEVLALKLHRLGRTSFRAVKSKRDYLGRRSNFSWLYLSRLAAIKEFAFMEALQKHDFPVPRAVDQNRHAVLMSMVDAYPFTQVKELGNPMMTYYTIMELLTRLAQMGLIHCDFNEFNLMIDDEENVTVIDFPQMVSTSHPNARDYFYRDVEGVVKFFERKLHYYPDEDAKLPYVRPNFDEIVAEADDGEAIDRSLQASGFKSKYQKVLEEAYAEQSGEGEEQEEGHEEEESSAEDAVGLPVKPPGRGSSHMGQPGEKTYQWVMGGSEVEALGARLVAVRLSEEGEGTVSCEIRCLATGPGSSSSSEEGVSGPGSSSEGEDASVQGSVAQARRQSAEQQVHERVVAQHRAQVKKAASTNASRNAMKNKVKKGKRGHSGKDGW
eukprot:CAMPEP_0117660320 /NCGR_PEP_ID=MMETSP0804-20121206/6906_1 /TAXON_ID=1074897 /ORGANISM="Tetraselmis astigmatica, Strain CCMP880" /LENGTH=495 /DNA_ID=CAMNT_0005467043 /DNA_START=156 /DNA_END=1643 /DNA_ORIENTATION=+